MELQNSQAIVELDVYLCHEKNTSHCIYVCDRVYLTNIMTYKSFESIISNVMSKVIVSCKEEK